MVNSRCLAIITSFVFTFIGCTKNSGNMNHLKDEKSPYLKQHSGNPVWWYPWGEEAIQKAKRENKPIFLSVGYSTCHWCHVMEKESFEDKEVADALNRSFISIKVDREERPDVDSIYMEAVHAMTGSGGWPMTVLLTPDREPFFGGTYFTKQSLLQILSKADEVWKKEPSKVREQGKKLVEWMQNQKLAPSSGDFSNNVFVKFYADFKQRFDSVNGGRLGKPKFPPAYALRLLLRIHRRTGEKNVLAMVTKTLDEMARGGIYDHVGGGFHRYSTDEKWLVPHFEKMLYDQAALLNAYLEAYQVTGNKEYELVAREIIDHVLRDMTTSDGGFFSAEDADSEREEGKFYVWTNQELKKLLSANEFSDFKKQFAISEGGNFEHGANILILRPSSTRKGRTPDLKQALNNLFQIRNKRVHPHRDEKVLTSWNGLFISALAKAGAVLGEKRYTESATRAVNFILTHNKDVKGNLLRRWANGESKYPGYLEDYAFLIDALIELFQATSDPKWIQEAEKLQATQEQLFFDPKNGGYFSTRIGDKLLIQRKKEFEDNVTPSGNSIATLNLLRLAAITFNQEYAKKADALLKVVPEATKLFPSGFPQLLMAVDYRLDQSKEIAIIADKDDPALQKVKSSFFSKFMPNKVIGVNAGTDSAVPLLKSKKALQEKPTVYVCVNRVCQFPTTDSKKALELAEPFEKFNLKQ